MVSFAILVFIDSKLRLTNFGNIRNLSGANYSQLLWNDPGMYMVEKKKGNVQEMEEVGCSHSQTWDEPRGIATLGSNVLKHKQSAPFGSTQYIK